MSQGKYPKFYYLIIIGSTYDMDDDLSVQGIKPIRKVVWK